MKFVFVYIVVKKKGGGGCSLTKEIIISMERQLFIKEIQLY